MSIPPIDPEPSALTRSLKILGKEVRLGRRIGSGANGQVYLAQKGKLSTHRPPYFEYPEVFVVKLIRREVCTPDFLQVVHRELTTIQKLTHPFVVGYVGSWVEASKGEYNGCFCLAMPYCDEGDLHSLISRFISARQFAPNELVVKLMAHVFAGLNYGHSRNVIHRDIKPANVFLTSLPGGDNANAVVDINAIPPSAARTSPPPTKIGKAMIGDYGLARPLTSSGQMVATRVGTPCYCSPEIVAAERYGTGTDIFSAGVMFYELMALERPFWRPGYTDSESFKDILNKNPIPRLQELAGGRYDPGLIRIVNACLAKHEKNRPTASEILTSFCPALTNYVNDRQIRVYPEHASKPPSPVRERTSPNKNGNTIVTPGRPTGATHASPVKPAARLTPSPVRLRSPYRKRCKSPPPPVHVDAEVTPSSQEQIAHADAGTEQQRRMLAVLNREFPVSYEETLLELLHNDVELYSCLRLFAIMHAPPKSTEGNTDSALALENKVLKVLLMFPSKDQELPITRICELICAEKG